MPELYRTSLNTLPAEALVVHCSDSRYGPAFSRFLDDHERLGAKQVLAVPGGPCSLVHSNGGEADRVAWQWVRFLIEKGAPPAVVLISHSDCLWYLHGPCAGAAGECERRQMEDLVAVGEELRRRFPAVAVRAYFARGNAGNVVFEEVFSAGARRA